MVINETQTVAGEDCALKAMVDGIAGACDEYNALISNSLGKNFKEVHRDLKFQAGISHTMVNMSVLTLKSGVSLPRQLFLPKYEVYAGVLGRLTCVFTTFC